MKAILSVSYADGTTDHLEAEEGPGKVWVYALRQGEVCSCVATLSDGSVWSVKIDCETAPGDRITLPIGVEAREQATR